MKTTKICKVLIALTLLFSITIPQHLSAQTKGFHYGVRLGLGESKVSLDGMSGERNKLTFLGGVASSYRVNRHIALNADFLFTSKGGERTGIRTENGVFGSTDFRYEERYNLYYFELPIAAQLSIPLGDDFALKGFGGPSVNFNLMSLQTRVYDDANYNEQNGFYDREIDDLNTTEYAWVYGVGVDVLGKDGRTFFLDFRRSVPATSLGYINNRSASSRYAAITAGYLF